MKRHEFLGGQAPASVLEREQRQRDALKTVTGISRAAGRDLKIVTSEDGGFGETPGIYLLDPRIAAKGPIKDTKFQFEERMLSGAADSAHAVIAGKLTVVHASGDVSMAEVAAKCYQKRDFEERMARASREVEVMKEMAQRGEETFNPVAVAVTSSRMGESVVLLTRFNEDLYTLDNTPWGRGPTAANVSNATQAAQALARFNVSGYVHRDAKIKNAASFAGRGVAMIDFETADPFDINSPEQAASAAYTDLEYMMSSLADKGLFTMRRGRDFRDNTPKIVSAVQTIIEDGYLPAWQGASPDVQTSVYEMATDVAENITHRSVGTTITV